ncbi:MAG: carbamoyl phosphate synthase small subunit [Clostridia bacterium]|nr:carbamoyl phosphate synthase small subunit [Clostridia bacterium]
MCFEGTRIGAPVSRMGELVFTTGMTGYMETLTDPSFFGQIVTHSFPLIGNYGTIPEDAEGESALFGYVVREMCDNPSNFRSSGTLNEYLKERGIPGLCGVDTREIVRVTREEGVMNAMICDTVPEDLSALRSFRVRNAVPSVTCPRKTVYPAAGKERFRVALMDYGAKRNLIRSLQKRGCSVTAWPASTDAQSVLAENPDGILLSNGPGDPRENEACVAQIRNLLGKKPMMGVCLGHQMTALAMGGETVKLKYGHRGGNQPVRDLKSGRTWITSQNHGYAVVAESLLDAGEVTFVNANDGSCEGMDYHGWNCFTVQFHPEACPGPQDTGFLFDRFIHMMEGREPTVAPVGRSPKAKGR